MTCEHFWQPVPELSGNVMTRYQCKHCRRWGWRKWPRHRGAKVPPIVEYVGEPTAGREAWEQSAIEEFEASQKEKADRWRAQHNLEDGE